MKPLPVEYLDPFILTNEPELLPRVIEEVLAYRAASEPPKAWSPIETSPKDGTRVLVFDPAMNSVYAAHWDCEFETKYDEETDVAGYRGAWTDGAVLSFGYEEVREYSPTHWQPLPAPPPSGWEGPTS